MKFTLSWLRDHLDTTASLDEITTTLTRVGLEVEGVENPAARLAAFTIAAVLSAEPHPNADRLRVCMVDTGAGAPVQVVCGAPNARAGMRSVFSPPGTYIPGKAITLGKGVIRGVESNGMLCSGVELQTSTDHDGILDLPADAPVGVPYAAWAGLDDVVIDVALTPNRPDATGVAGIARDLAAAGLGRLKTPVPEPIAGAFPCPVGVTLALGEHDAALAPAFALRLVRGVVNGPSPDWLRRRLEAIGLRSINALVDVTNFMTFDRGRPLHVFDAAKVHGALTVRRAALGESLLALDGRSYALDADTVVIADTNGPESIAGIMGGEASGCDEGTTDVLIESALWSPLSIAQTGRRLGIVTDARYRFERGVDPAYTVPGLDLATRMILDLCGGSPSEPTLAGTVPTPDHRIEFPWSEVQRLTGLDLPMTDMRAILERLGFTLVGVGGNADQVIVRVPTWRPDVEGKADLVEEIVRIAGIDRVAAVPLPREAPGVPAPVLTLLQKRVRMARHVLAAQGLVEAVTWSFVSGAEARLFGGGAADLTLVNPIAADLSDMRPSLLPGLIAAVRRNVARGKKDLALFEVGQVFLGRGEGDQRLAAAVVRRGTAKRGGSGRHWDGASGDVDLFDVKADVIALLETLGVPTGGLQIVRADLPTLHPGRSGRLQLGPKVVLGTFGEVHPATLAALDVTGPLCVMEIILDALPAPKVKPTKAKPRLDVSDLMPVERDYAFVVDQSIDASAVVKAAQAADRQVIVDVTVFDVFAGQGIEPGHKSVAVAVTLQPREKTLSEGEIEQIGARIIAEVGKKTGGRLRG